MINYSFIVQYKHDNNKMIMHFCSNLVQVYSIKLKLVCRDEMRPFRLRLTSLHEYEAFTSSKPFVFKHNVCLSARTIERIKCFKHRDITLLSFQICSLFESTISLSANFKGLLQSFGSMFILNYFFIFYSSQII